MTATDQSAGEQPTPAGPGHPPTDGRAPGGMWWVAWRQHRFHVAVAVGLSALVAAALIVFRAALVDWLQEVAGPAWPACAGPGQDPQCPAVVANTMWDTGLSSAWDGLQLAVLALPPVTGVFVGVALFSREFEQRTQVFALTQSVGRMRWWATKIVVAGVPMLLAVLGVGYLAEWAATPWTGFSSGRLNDMPFQTFGPVPALVALLMFGLGVAAGIVTRSTVIGLVASLILGVVLVGLITLWLRPNLVASERLVEPVTGAGSTSISELDRDPWYLGSGYLDAAGDEVSFDVACSFDWDATLSEAELEAAYEQSQQRCYDERGIVSSYTDWVPSDRRGVLQLATGGVYAGLTALFLAIGAWRLRRRVL